MNGGAGQDDDKLSDYVPGSRDLSVSRAVSVFSLLVRQFSGYGLSSGWILVALKYSRAISYPRVAVAMLIFVAIRRGLRRYS
jgi:hypothetical protein